MNNSDTKPIEENTDFNKQNFEASSECRQDHLKPVDTRRSGYRNIKRNGKKQNRKPNQET